MRTEYFTFSLLKASRCRVHSSANNREGALHCFGDTSGNNSIIRLHGLRTYGLDGVLGTNWNQRHIATKAEESKETTRNTKSKSTKQEILRQTILTSANLNVSKVNEWLIEIALRDLQDGVNSTFQTLVNPQHAFPNSHIHGIATNMVNRPDVPRMEDLIPILLKYIESRQKHGGPVLWIAHNARTFDVPFLYHEFTRCSTEAPRNWLFLDTFPLARELMKSGGTNLSSTSLVALRELYKIKVDGFAHRAMVDVNTLCQILPMLTSDLKLSLPCLVKKSFSISDLVVVLLAVAKCWCWNGG
ncbi:hypothetical protein RJT34_23009 [Clitoria ternatea]|uniref:Exonuclease domain-containing protein n=1 Tax=Clitoria ternatea TaxID=43366 RepID=A0AAN9IEJ4_CLITE